MAGIVGSLRTTCRGLGGRRFDAMIRFPNAGSPGACFISSEGLYSNRAGFSNEECVNSLYCSVLRGIERKKERALACHQLADGNPGLSLAQKDRSISGAWQ
jgi:hypothetical protein